MLLLFDASNQIVKHLSGRQGFLQKPAPTTGLETLENRLPGGTSNRCLPLGPLQEISLGQRPTRGQGAQSLACVPENLRK
jgi:hypothetical protein